MMIQSPVKLAKPKNIVYLYSEVMPYAIAVMRVLALEFGIDVDCVYWDKNKRTPFVPVNEKGITFHKRSEFNKASLLKFMELKNPVLIYVSGRMDPLYLKTALKVRDKCVVVSGCDNQWLGSVKQKVAVILSHMVYRRYFEYFWVPGPRQFEFARRVGYSCDKILKNHFSADAPVYNKAYHDNKMLKQSGYPHNIVFAGRFAKEKGLDILIEAFTEAKKELQNDWKLTLIGAGDMPVTNQPYIEIKGFMSGDELALGCREWGVFCLPSIREPWGVVIHEFTCAGLPVICSDSVGAGDVLVIGNYNGFVFKSGDKASLKQTILMIMSKTDNELALMGERSHELSKMNSPVIGAYSLVSMLK